MLQRGIGDDGVGLYDSEGARAHAHMQQPYKQLAPAGHADTSSVCEKQAISVLRSYQMFGTNCTMSLTDIFKHALIFHSNTSFQRLQTLSTLVKSPERLKHSFGE